jgi:hypothetical protein
VYLIDTNILIYHFANQIPIAAQETLDKIFKDHFNISVITKIEFLGWKNFNDKQLKKATEFLGFATVINMSKPVIDKTIKIRQTHNIRLPDAVIAATALSRNMTLVTRNADDFKGIKIKIYNPFGDS